MNQRLQYSSMSLNEYIHSIEPSQRVALLGEFCDTTPGYILKRVYTPDDEISFKMKIAVGLDKLSGGKVDFRDILTDGDQIDWEYIRKELNRRRPDAKKSRLI